MSSMNKNNVIDGKGGNQSCAHFSILDIWFVEIFDHFLKHERIARTTTNKRLATKCSFLCNDDCKQIPPIVSIHTM